MTTAGPDGPLTAADLLFGPSADIPDVLTRRIMSAGHALNLGQALKHLPRVTREAAAREAAAAAAGLLKVDLIDLLVAGWREHRDLISAARRTLDTPGSRELVGVAAHRIKTVQQPAVSVLIDGRRVHTLQLGLSIVFDVTGLVAGVSAGRLAGLHAGRSEIGVALTVHEIEVLTKRAHHLELPGVKALKSAIRLLPAGEYPSSEHVSSELAGSEHFSSEFAGSGPSGDHHSGSGFPGVELLRHQLPIGAHASSAHASSAHPGGQANGAQHLSGESGVSEHPSSGNEDHPSTSGSAPWWEDAGPVPPPSRS